MAKVLRPAYSQSASGTLGDIVFDKRGYTRTKPKKRTKPQSAAQGNVQQSFAAARKAVNVVNDEIKEAIKRHKWLKRKIRRKKGLFQPGFWAVYLASEMRGLKRAMFIYMRKWFDGLDSHIQILWHKAGIVVGLNWVNVPHASEAAIGPGLQLFWLARTLYRLDIYRDLGVPEKDNVLLWAASITGRDLDEICEAVEGVTDWAEKTVTKPNPILQPNMPQTKAIQPIKSIQPTPTAIKENKPTIEQTHHTPLEPLTNGLALANGLTEQLQIITQNSFLPLADEPYYSHQLGAGNGYDDCLAQFLLPSMWHGNTFDTVTPIISDLEPKLNSDKDIDKDIDNSAAITTTSSEKKQAVATAIMIKEPELKLETVANSSEIVKQLIVFVLGFLWPTVLKHNANKKTRLHQFINNTQQATINLFSNGYNKQLTPPKQTSIVPYSPLGLRVSLKQPSKNKNASVLNGKGVFRIQKE